MMMTLDGLWERVAKELTEVRMELAYTRSQVHELGNLIVKLERIINADSHDNDG